MTLDLAPEILIQIMQFCSPNSLSSLSRVQTSLRDIAEYLLYSRVHFYARPLDLIQDWRSGSCRWALKEKRSLLHTLIANVRKAGMVKTLYIELETVIFCTKYSFENLKALHSFLLKLSEALQHMPDLVDLRIVHEKTTSDISQGSLTQAIRFVLLIDHRFLVVIFGRCAGVVIPDFTRYAWIALMISRESSPPSPTYNSSGSITITPIQLCCRESRDFIKMLLPVARCPRFLRCTR